MKYFEVIFDNFLEQPFYIKAQTIEEAIEIMDNSQRSEYSFMMDLSTEIRGAPFFISEIEESTFKKLGVKDNDVIKYVQVTFHSIDARNSININSMNENEFYGVNSKGDCFCSYWLFKKQGDYIWSVPIWDVDEQMNGKNKVVKIIEDNGRKEYDVVKINKNIDKDLVDLSYENVEKYMDYGFIDTPYPYDFVVVNTKTPITKIEIDELLKLRKKVLHQKKKSTIDNDNCRMLIFFIINILSNYKGSKVKYLKYACLH
ncbi:MAG: hypothetical protein RR623_01585 [Bacilli bacterium]